MNSRTKLVFVVHLAATMFMVGVIWFVQIVHYPLFSRVGEPGFAAYSESHTLLTGFVVFPPMVAELAAAILLVALRPPGVPPFMLWFGVALLAIVWLSTAALQVPAHAKLAAGFDEQTHDFLVATNWVRTVAWSMRGAVVLWMANKMLR